MAAQAVGGRQTRSHREGQKPLLGLLEGKWVLKHSRVARGEGPRVSACTCDVSVRECDVSLCQCVCDVCVCVCEVSAHIHRL